MIVTIDEVATMLRTTPGAARGVLDRLNVKPINLGPGRGLGLRWFDDEILTALDAQRKPKHAKKHVQHLITGRSVAELVNELTGKHVVQ